MEHIETVLTARAISTGTDIRRGKLIDGLDQSADQVTVCCGNETFHARWLVGCDGGRSAVRKLADFQFVGTEPSAPSVSATRSAATQS